MNKCVLFRKNVDDFNNDQDDEFFDSFSFFKTVEYRTLISTNSLVIGRYSVLPFYKELEKELNIRNSFLINNYLQHRYIADITNYYEDLKEFTPKTYTEWGSLPEGKYIVKGKTNSRKHNWNTHMFAKDKKSLLEIINRLYDDSFIWNQGLVVREYVPLEKLDEGINGVPISNEWRFFYYKENMLCNGYYWANFPDLNVKLDYEMIKFSEKIAKIVAKKANFFVLDIAKKVDNGYILIEVNDGQMSGLSNCKSKELYKNLSECLRREDYVRD